MTVQYVKVKQSKDNTEEVSSAVLDKISNIVGSDGNLSGKIHASAGYTDTIATINQKFPDLDVSVDSEYIKFEDEELLAIMIDPNSKCANSAGSGTHTISTDGVGVTIDDAEICLSLLSYRDDGNRGNDKTIIKRNTITYFNEAKYFKNVELGLRLNQNDSSSDVDRKLLEITFPKGKPIGYNASSFGQIACAMIYYLNLRKADFHLCTGYNVDYPIHIGGFRHDNNVYRVIIPEEITYIEQAFFGSWYWGIPSDYKFCYGWIFDVPSTVNYIGSRACSTHLRMHGVLILRNPNPSDLTLADNTALYDNGYDRGTHSGKTNLNVYVPESALDGYTSKFSKYSGYSVQSLENSGFYIRYYSEEIKSYVYPYANGHAAYGWDDPDYPDAEWRESWDGTNKNDSIQSVSVYPLLRDGSNILRTFTYPYYSTYEPLSYEQVSGQEYIAFDQTGNITYTQQDLPTDGSVVIKGKVSMSNGSNTIRLNFEQKYIG